MNEPARQSAHWEAPPAANLPRVQASHAHAPAPPAYRPAGHSRHAEARYSANVPGRHARQAVDAVSLEKVPSSHQLQTPVIDA